MTIVTRAAALQRATQIANEQAARANTAIRVGTLFQDIVDSVYFFGQESATGYDVVVLGAVPNSQAAAAANTAIIQAAMIAASAAGGGVVTFTAGTFWIDDVGSNIALSATGLSNVTLRGMGAGITVIKQVDGANANIVNIDGASNIEICYLTIDGNRAGNSAGTHGVRTGNSGCDGLAVHHCEIKDTVAYGLGLQGGDKKRVFIEHCYIHSTGADCIDIKNRDSGNEVLVISNVVVESWGLDGSLTVQAGIDCRGPCQLDNVWVFEPPADGYGIRFREGEIGTPTVGLGAHRSHMTNAFVDMSGSTTGIGIYSAARDVTVEGCWVTAANEGLMFFGERCVASGVTCEACTNRGFLLTVEATDSVLSACQSNTCVTGFRIRAPRVTLHGPKSVGDTTVGITTESAAVGLSVTDPKIVGVGGATMIGIDINSADASVVGGYVTACNRGIVSTGARTKCIAVTSTANVDDGILLAVGADDSLVSGCSLTDNTDDGISVRSDRVLVRDNVITGNTQNAIAIESGGDNTRIAGNRLASNGAAIDDAGLGTVIYDDNDGLGGRVARSINEAVASTATSANIDVPIVAAKTYLFRLKAVAEDSNGDRACKVVLIETLRSASAAPTTPTQGAFFVSGDGANLTVNNTISGNNLRLSVTNGMGHDCRLTTVVEEVYRDTTAEFS